MADLSREKAHLRDVRGCLFLLIAPFLIQRALAASAAKRHFPRLNSSEKSVQQTQAPLMLDGAQLIVIVIRVDGNQVYAR